MQNPKIPRKRQEEIQRAKENAYTLYLDCIVDGSASMYSVFPAVYYAMAHFIDALSTYEVHPKLGITLFRGEKNLGKTEFVTFENDELYTDSSSSFLKNLKEVKLYGGGLDAREPVHTAIRKSLQKFPGNGRNRAILVFTDAYESEDSDDYIDFPIGQAIFFSTEELSEEDFRFCFVQEDGEQDEESSPMFLSLASLLKPMSTELIENVAKPLKDLMKGVSIGG